MNEGTDFKDLFIFEMANNHQGQLDHGLRIIQEMSQIAKANKIRAGVKFQFRQLDTFIHPAHQKDTQNKHIPRFLSTRLKKEDFAKMTEAVKRAGMVSICTPFDEDSVDQIVELGIDIVKIGSCSATDWPLLEKVADCNKPVIFSTGGLTVKQIDDLVSFFEHRKVHFAILQCVGIYPTPDDKMQMNQIDFLRRRYRETVIGISSHEDPNSMIAVQVAVAKGAQIFERHVGVPTETIKLNAYSSNPEQIDRWVKATLQAKVLCGGQERLRIPEEQEALASLKRGVFLHKAAKPGTVLKREDVYFAMPLVEGQLTSGEWKEGVIALEEIQKEGPALRAKLKLPHDTDAQVLYTAIHSMKGLLNEAKIALNTDFKAEFSHHYGIAKFLEWGTTIIECFNRDYCKKILIMLPGQKHPSHFHKKKEETFQVLHGILHVEVDGRERTLYPGDIQLVAQGVWHRFWSDTGAVFDEISSTHFNDDSFYQDKSINKLQRHERKTVVNNWGRYQIAPEHRHMAPEAVTES